MTLMNIRKKLRHLWRRYGTMNNIVIVVALAIAASWAWGSVTAMQRNFALQKTNDEQRQLAEPTQLQVDTLKYQQNYYKSDEYKELSARMYLGLAGPGEKVLILPPNSAGAKDEEAASAIAGSRSSANASASNLEQWVDFLTGRNVAG